MMLSYVWNFRRYYRNERNENTETGSFDYVGKHTVFQSRRQSKLSEGAQAESGGGH